MWVAAHLSLERRLTLAQSGGKSARNLVRNSGFRVPGSVRGSAKAAGGDRRTRTSMANQTLIPPPPPAGRRVASSAADHDGRVLVGVAEENIRAALFPEKLPPLQLTSRPVKVREIWGEYSYKKESASVSLVVHVAMIAALIAAVDHGRQGRQGAAETDGYADRSRSHASAIADDQEERQNFGRRWWRRRSRQIAGAQGQAAQDRDGADHSSGNGHSQRSSQACPSNRR